MFLYEDNDSPSCALCIDCIFEFPIMLYPLRRNSKARALSSPVISFTSYPETLLNDNFLTVTDEPVIPGFLIKIVSLQAHP